MIRILVVEDQVNNMRLIEQLIEDLGENIELVKAYTGKQAIEMVDKGPFALVLMDISLPDMDGIETTKALKDYDILAKTPFIAVTAHATLQDEMYFRENFDDYIPKPIHDDNFMKIIVKWLGDRENE